MKIYANQIDLFTIFCCATKNSATMARMMNGSTISQFQLYNIMAKPCVNHYMHGGNFETRGKKFATSACFTQINFIFNLFRIYTPISTHIWTMDLPMLYICHYYIVWYCAGNEFTDTDLICHHHHNNNRDRDGPIAWPSLIKQQQKWIIHHFYCVLYTYMCLCGVFAHSTYKKKLFFTELFHGEWKMYFYIFA